MNASHPGHGHSNSDGAPDSHTPASAPSEHTGFLIGLSSATPSSNPVSTPQTMPASTGSSTRSHGPRGHVLLPSKPEGYELGKKVGNRVWKARCEALEKEVVVKTIAFDVTRNPQKTAKVEGALEHFKTLSHPHLIGCLHSFYVDKELWVIEDGRGWEDDTCRSLLRTADDESVGLSERVLAALARPVLLALQYLHASGRAWSDVRGKNIFVQRDGTVLANLVTLRSVVQEKTRDSLPFVAPELLGSGAADFNTGGKGDIWSLGITLLELATRNTPYADHTEQTPQQITQRIIQEPPPSLPDDGKWSQEFREFLAKCLVKDPATRASADDLLRHAWIQGAQGAEFLAQKLFNGSTPPPAPTMTPSPIPALNGPTPIMSPLFTSSATSDGERSERESKDRDQREPNGENKGADEESKRFVEVQSNATVPTLVIAQPGTSKGPQGGTGNNSSSSASQTAPQAQQGQGSTHVQRVGAHNVPVETILGESAHEYVVFLRTIPCTKVTLRLESRSLIITGELPALHVGDTALLEDLVLLEPAQTRFEKRIVFGADIDPNSFRKVLDKESSMMTIRIRKFSHRDLGSDEF